MSTGAINNLSGYYLQQVLAGALQSAGLTTNPSTTTSSTSASSSPQSDTSRLSPFAQLAVILQQLQQSDPTKYKQVTAQIATTLQAAAQTAQSEGNSSAANQLTQLATDFTNASQSGQLPNLQDLAQAVGGSRGHHHHRHAEASSSDSSTAGSGSGGNTSPALSQLLSSLSQTSESQSTQNPTIDPGTIILQTLANAGINVSNLQRG
jgi:hypothetical protein